MREVVVVLCVIRKPDQSTEKFSSVTAELQMLANVSG